MGSEDAVNYEQWIRAGMKQPLAVGGQTVIFIERNRQNSLKELIMSQININNKFDDLDKANDEKYVEIDNRIEELKKELDRGYQTRYNKSISYFAEDFMKGNHYGTLEESIVHYSYDIADNNAAALFEWAKENVSSIDRYIAESGIDVANAGIIDAVKGAQAEELLNDLTRSADDIEDICSLIAFKDVVASSTSFDGIDYSDIDLDDYMSEMAYLNGRTANLGYDDIRNNAKECIDEFVELASDRERD